MAATTLEELQVLITAETKGLRKELNLVKMQLDGTSKAVAKSTAGITAGLKKLGVAIAGAFAIKKVAQFGATAIRTASELEGAMLGLQSILEGQGRSFRRANSFIQEYIQDGLVPLTDAVTAYKNLAARGYNDEQIQQVMERLKDAAAFGRQSSYTLGQAVASATEGLKNENSILVDNAGVTKNVAKMWDEYARGIGKNAQQLTQQEKIQAEVNGIMQETRFQVGDAAKYADTFAGRLAALNKTLRDVQVNLGQAFMPIANVVLPLLQSMANALARVTAFVSQFMQALFGSNKAAAQGAKKVADAHVGIGDAIEESGKKAKGAVAGFDEINQLTEPAEGAGGGVGAAGALELDDPGLDVENEGGIIGEALSGISVRAQEMADKARGAFAAAKESIHDFGQRVKEAFSGFGETLVPLQAAIEPIKAAFADIGQSAIGLYNTFLKPVVEYFLLDFIPSIVTAISGTFAPIFADIAVFAVQLFADEFAFAVSHVKKVWDNVLLPVFELIRQVVLDTLQIVTDLWDRYGRTLLDNIADVMAGIRETFTFLWDEVLLPIIAPFLDMLTWLWEEHLRDLVYEIGAFVMTAINAALEIYNGFIKPIIDWLVKTLGPQVALAFNFVTDVIGSTLAFVSDLFAGLLETLRGVIDFIVGVFTGDWERAWEGVRDIFKGIFDTLWGIVKYPLNLIIDGVNLLISGLNKISFDIPSWVPFMGGKSFGINIPPIPKLARGGLIDQPMIAMLGEQGREAVVPLENTGFVNALANAVASAVGTAVLQAAQVTGGGQGDKGRPIVLYLNGREVARGIIPALDDERTRMGGLQAVIKPV